jgi:hypothetical protein
MNESAWLSCFIVVRRILARLRLSCNQSSDGKKRKQKKKRLLILKKKWFLLEFWGLETKVHTSHDERASLHKERRKERLGRNPEPQNKNTQLLRYLAAAAAAICESACEASPPPAPSPPTLTLIVGTTSASTSLAFTAWCPCRRVALTPGCHSISYIDHTAWCLVFSLTASWCFL